MNSKKKIFIFLTISLLIVLALPVLNYIINPRELSKEKLFNTDIFESYRNYLGYKLFSRSYYNHSVISGKNGFLFLGNKHNYLVSKTQNNYPKHPKAIKIWVNNLYKLQQWYESQGIQFVLVVVPNKHTVYNEYLPSWVILEKGILTDDILKESNKAGLNIINLKDDLKKNKTSSELIYSISDSHWNSKGAAIGFHRTIEFLNNKYSINLTTPSYLLKKRKSSGGGLSRLLKMDGILGNDFETMYFIKSKKPKGYCHGDINSKSLLLKDCKIGDIEHFNIHKGPQYSLNPQAVNDQKLLLLCDSFSMQNSKLYDNTFKTIWKLHYNKLLNNKLSKFVKNNKPDIVIYQVVERKLFNNKFIKYK